MAETDNVVARWEPVLARKPGEEPSTLLFLPLAHVFGRMVEVACVAARVRLGPPAEHGGRRPHPRPRRVPADLRAGGAVRLREGLPGRPPQGRDRRASSARSTRRWTWRSGTRRPWRPRRSAPGPGRAAGPADAAPALRQARLQQGARRARRPVRHAISGGSAMERRLGLFFGGAGVTIYEGYGLTETTAAATANPPEQTRFGTVGRPVPGTTVHDRRGRRDLAARRPGLRRATSTTPKATDEVLRDGWLATGDIGSLDEDGYLTITGRKKEILVTSGGKSVSPVALEDRVRAHPLVAQCMVVGNDRPYVAALVTLDPEAVAHWLTMRGKPRLQRRRSWCATRTWRRRSGGRSSPPTPWSRRPSRSAPSAYWPAQFTEERGHADAVAEAQAAGDRERRTRRDRGALRPGCCAWAGGLVVTARPPGQALLAARARCQAERRGSRPAGSVVRRPGSPPGRRRPRQRLAEHASRLGFGFRRRGHRFRHEEQRGQFTPQVVRARTAPLPGP